MTDPPRDIQGGWLPKDKQAIPAFFVVAGTNDGNRLCHSASLHGLQVNLSQSIRRILASYIPCQYHKSPFTVLRCTGTSWPVLELNGQSLSSIPAAGRLLEPGVQP
jgi:hypothetical protein